MNVSWSQFAPLFVLERFPEARDRAELLGGDRARIDHWRRLSYPQVFRFFCLIFEIDYAADWRHLSIVRILSRLRGFDGIEPYVAPMFEVYRKAHERGHPAALLTPERMFAGFAGAANPSASAPGDRA